MGKRTRAQVNPENKKVRKPKVKKEGPKKPKSAFMFFSQERRKTLKEEQPDLKITDASKVIGSEWRKLTDSDKGPYNQLAQQDKERYMKEKEEAKAQESKEEEKEDVEEAKESSNHSSEELKDDDEA